MRTLVAGGIAVGVVVLLLLRPWQLPDPAARERSALAAAVLLGTLLLMLCVNA
jgi:hypothetical protein